MRMTDSAFFRFIGKQHRGGNTSQKKFLSNPVIVILTWNFIQAKYIYHDIIYPINLQFGLLPTELAGQREFSK